VELDEAELTVTIHARIDSAVCLGCPCCQREAPRYDVRWRRWRHLDTMQFGTFIDAEVPRVECPEHGVLQVRVPWAEDASRYTAAFELGGLDLYPRPAVMQ
jgi:transposase